MAYDNTNSGVLFKNDRKESDKHPDYKGSINVGGRDYWLSAWINTAKKGDHAGKKFMSLKIQEKDYDSSSRTQTPRDYPSSNNWQSPDNASQEFDDDLPF